MKKTLLRLLLTAALATMPAWAVSISSTDTPLGIADGSGTATGGGATTSSIFIGLGGTITDISIEIDLTHTYAGDLVVTLTRGVTTITIFDRPGVPPGSVGSGSDFVGFGYIFEDGGGDLESAIYPVIPSTVPLGTYAAQDSMLGAFGGTSLTGTWILSIEDFAGGDTGTLNSWTINLNESAPPAVPEPSTVVLFGASLLGFAAYRKRCQG